jgi:hypothetical protein
VEQRPEAAAVAGRCACGFGVLFCFHEQQSECLGTIFVFLLDWPSCSLYLNLQTCFTWGFRASGDQHGWAAQSHVGGGCGFVQPQGREAVTPADPNCRGIIKSMCRQLGCQQVFLIRAVVVPSQPAPFPTSLAPLPLKHPSRPRFRGMHVFENKKIVARRLKKISLVSHRQRASSCNHDCQDSIFVCLCVLLAIGVRCC